MIVPRQAEGADKVLPRCGDIGAGRDNFAFGLVLTGRAPMFIALASWLRIVVERVSGLPPLHCLFTQKDIANERAKGNPSGAFQR
ncbi:hypothetical protein NOJ28_15460 [Neorhizobium galegae]|uniref:hypothetical protein n=1 Tax=Neorhizobium galegae TaxID=399 RepID=UPI002107B1C9|nr:hypothetical protein [Neorhizobium galegae]MCQ1766935.1 hypothetical protein [Neorhizobium galegae]MCQ1849098.1 hypothetical protein [Neorhizobium galegae]